VDTVMRTKANDALGAVGEIAGPVVETFSIEEEDDEQARQEAMRKVEEERRRVEEDCTEEETGQHPGD